MVMPVTQDMGKWFDKWDGTHLLHDAPLDSFVHEAFLQHDMGKCGGSHITNYTTDVGPNYKIILFAKWGNHTH